MEFTKEKTYKHKYDYVFYKQIQDVRVSVCGCGCVCDEIIFKVCRELSRVLGFLLL